MNGRTAAAIGISILILAAALMVAWRSQSNDDALVGSNASAPSSTASGDRAVGSDDDSLGASGVAVTPPEAPAPLVPSSAGEGRDATIRGRVTDPGEVALLDAEIRIHRTEANPDVDDPDAGPVRVKRTKADGTFVADGLEPGSYRLRIGAEGFRRTDVHGIVLDEGEVETLDVRLDRGLGISGRVVDAEDRGIAKAQVTTRVAVRAFGDATARVQISSAPDPLALLDARTETDDEGRFTLTGLAAGEVGLSIQRAGFAEGRVERVAAGTEGLVIELTQGGTVAGRVVDREGSPVYLDVSIELFGPEMTGQVILPDTSGEFRLEHVASGEHRLSIRSGEFVPQDYWDLTVREGETLALGTIELDEGAVLTGRVVTVDGEGAAGVLRVWPEGTRMPTEARVLGAEGHFEWSVLPLDRPLRLDVDGGARGHLERSMTLDVRRVDLGELVLTAPARLEGHVRLDGVPLAGVRVRLEPIGTGGARTISDKGQFTRTDAAGSYRFEGPRPGEMLLHVEASGCVRHEERLTIAESESRELDVDLVRGESITGRVVDVSGRPIDGAKLTLFPGAGQGRALEAVAGEDGRFEFVGLPHGACVLDASARGLARQRVRDLAPGTRDLEIVLVAAGTIVGRVIDRSSGEAVMGFEVSAMRAGGGGHGPGLFGAQRFHDLDGRFRLVDLDPGRYLVTVRSTGFVPAAVDVQVEAGALAELGVEIERGGAVVGRVVDARGEPIHFASVRRKLSDAEERRRIGTRVSAAQMTIPTADGVKRVSVDPSGESVVTDAEGRFVLDQLPAGVVELLVEDDQHLERVVEGVRVDRDEERSLAAEIVLEDGASVHGVVAAPESVSIADAYLTIASERAGRRPILASVGEDGSFRVRGLTAGVQRLELFLPRAKGEGPQASLELDLGADEERRIELQVGE